MQVSIQTSNSKLAGQLSKPRSAELYIQPIVDPTIIHTLVLVDDLGKSTMVNLTVSQCKLIAEALASRVLFTT